MIDNVMAEELTAQEYVGSPPDTLEEAIQRVTALIKADADESLWQETEESFLSTLHHALGQHIRNYWGLWSQDSGLYKELSGRFMLSHADDLSGLVLTAVYRRYHDLSLNLEKEAARYHKHWIEILRNEN